MKTKFFSSAISFLIATLLAFLPFNYIVGSKFAYFSCANIAIPSLGYQYSLLYVIFYFFTKTVCFSSFSLFAVLSRLPLFFATLALQYWDFRISICLPLSAMILFCIHPVGYQAFYYSWYWFIPMGIYCFGGNTIYNRAITASFIAHAVGSIIWLYMGRIVVAQVWTALIPVVIIERLYIALGMLGCVALFNFIDQYIARKVYA